MADVIVVRALFILLLSAISFSLQPLGLPAPVSAAIGALLGGTALLAEHRLRVVSLPRILGATAGTLTGAVIGLLTSLVIGRAVDTSPTAQFWQLSVLLVCLYVGFAVGASKGEILNLSALGGLVGADKTGTQHLLLLDTSVIIDGRIADIAETGFIDEGLAIPQFVLRELQLVADSADSLKRNRGRRGLDVLQRLQKMPQLKVQIIEQDFPHVKDVDMKLVELGKLFGSKVVTNDFNLNKVAQLHGVEVLNINELANALKPVVLPGEIMRVFVLKEGKEYNQGVAYLDDGTMVVVDNARRQISKTIDISVTSVLQTTAGKMIFGKFDERTHAVYEKIVSSAERAERTQRESTATAPQS